MYMNSAPHLLTEDRPEFERVLDEALRATALTPAAGAAPLNSEQLRTMALSAAAAISACAAAEYDHYLRMRAQQRAAGSARPPGSGDPGHATAGGGAGDASSGAGLFPTVAVLTPILAGAAALIFLLVGYVLAAMDPEPAIAAPLRTAGWLFLVIAGAGIVFDIVGLLLTALRDGSSAIRASQGEDLTDLSAARQAWHDALLERGMLPFLREALAGSAAAQRRAESEEPEDDGILPPPRRPGYSHPEFAGPGGEEPYSGPSRFSSPRFSSPDFSSPDFTGPDRDPDPR